MTSRHKSQQSEKLAQKFPNMLKRPNVFQEAIILELGAKPSKTMWSFNQEIDCINSWECVFCPVCEVPRLPIADASEGPMTCPHCDIVFQVQLLKHANFAVTFVED